MSPAKRAVWREGTAEDPELVPMRVKIWISSQWPKINRQKSCNHNHRPCRWFAQAPLGPITSRAYSLIEFSFCCMMRPTAIEIAVCRILLFVTLDYLPF